MYIRKIDKTRLKSVLKIHRTVIGRSDDVFRNIFFKDEEISATDGCLRVFSKVDFKFPGRFAVNSDVLWAFVKHSQDQIEMNLKKGAVELSSADMTMFIKETETVFPAKEECLVNLAWMGKEFLKGLDFVSRALDEDDFVEVHSQKDVIGFLGKTKGIIGIFVHKRKEGQYWTGKVPFQSARRLYKACEDFSEFRILGGREGLCVEVHRTLFNVCKEEVERAIKFPEFFEGERVDRRRILKIFEKVNDILGKADVYFIMENGKAVVYGKRRGIEFRVEENINYEGGFRTVVPARKFRTFLSLMPGRYLYVGEKGEVVRFRERNGQFFIVTKRLA